MRPFACNNTKDPFGGGLAGQCQTSSAVGVVDRPGALFGESVIFNEVGAGDEGSTASASVWAHMR